EAPPVDGAPAPAEPAAEAPAPRRRRKAAEPAIATPVAETLTEDEPVAEPAAEGEGDGNESPRRGWWQRTFGA
uniref:hypothetical protein n=1 Tax=Sphingomonas bacterium TaxID=1895847 RepID=UPI001574F993